jgi:endonuclease/exonuclease/phosphatase family metal-dependent hydrolase
VEQMTLDWTDRPVTTVVRRLASVPFEVRQALRRGPADRRIHDAFFDELPLFRQIEAGGTVASRPEIHGSARVAFWNVERLRHIDAVGDTLADLAPDVMLLCEIDRGMARSGNSDRVRMLADRLGAAYLYAVEFLELDLGDVHEKRTHAGEVNSDGLHGAALLSNARLSEPFLIRIDRRGDWFDGARDEPRVGGTIAIGAEVVIAGAPVLMVNVHLESHDGPQERAGDMRRLLEQIEMVASGGAVILGGDFNTSSFARRDIVADPQSQAIALAADPMRLVRPQDYEPLFEVAASFGYSSEACNVPDKPTTRRPVADPRPPRKLDWFFTRKLAARDPRIMAALRPDGAPSSDHECLVVTVDPVP